MLEVGQRIMIQGRYAEQMWYEDVERQGAVIIKGPVLIEPPMSYYNRSARGSYYTVQPDHDKFTWDIHEDDCLPTDTNKKASLLLDKEW